MGALLHSYTGSSKDGTKQHCVFSPNYINQVTPQYYSDHITGGGSSGPPGLNACWDEIAAFVGIAEPLHKRRKSGTGAGSSKVISCLPSMSVEECTSTKPAKHRQSLPIIIDPIEEYRAHNTKRHWRCRIFHFKSGRTTLQSWPGAMADIAMAGVSLFPCFL